MKRRLPRRVPISEASWLQDGMFGDRYGGIAPATAREPLYLQPIRERSARQKSRRLRERKFRQIAQLLFIGLAVILAGLFVISVLSAIEAPRPDTGTVINQLGENERAMAGIPNVESEQAFTENSFTQAVDSPVISAQSAILIVMDERQVLFKKDAYVRRAPASFAKLALAVVALEINSLSKVVVVPEDAAMQPGPRVGLLPGEALPLKDLLFVLLLPSGNDAAIALADGRGYDFSVSMMNDLADRLDLKDTQFVNPSGFDAAEQYTTAYDAAVLATDAMDRFPLLAEIVSSRTHVIPERARNRSYSLKNLNELLWSYEGATGVKTGTTEDAGENLIVTATRNGHSLMAVIMGSSDRAKDAKTLLDFGFRAVRALG